MLDWFEVPWVQYGLAPFVAGLAVAEMLNRLRISGFAVIAGIVVAASLSARSLPSLSPVSASERIVLAAAIASLVGLILDLAPKLRRPVAAIVALCAGALVVWTAWPAATADNWRTVLAPAGLGVLYAVWTAGTLTLLADSPERAGAAGVALGGAAGVCAYLAGLPQLAAIAFAAAAASGAYLLIQAISNVRLSCGTLFVLPLAAACALVPPVAVLQGRLPWYFAAALALVPATALIPFSERFSTRARVALAVVIAATAGAAVAAIASHVMGGPVAARKYQPVPPTVSPSMRSVGCPTPTGTLCPSLPQVPTPVSSAMSLPIMPTRVSTSGPLPISVAPFTG